MRLAALACLALILAACQPAAETPADAPAPAVTQAPVMPIDAPPQEEAGPAPAPEPEPASCREAVGETASARLVERCIAVSPATRPPCNALNPCALIQGEIDRACGQYGRDETKPADCAA
jgi:hypothetical protein